MGWVGCKVMSHSLATAAQVPAALHSLATLSNMGWRALTQQGRAAAAEMQRIMLAQVWAAWLIAALVDGGDIA